MVQERESENFQPRIVASFNRGQLIKVLAWGRENKVTGKDALDRALESVGIDEQGNIMNETSRRRLRYGVAVLTGLIKARQSLNNLLQAQVWQKTPDEDRLTVLVRYNRASWSSK